MQFPGHIAAGYLTAVVFLKLTSFDLTLSEIHLLLFLGAVIGFLPDLDNIPIFIKLKSFAIPTSISHRDNVGHAPLLWCLTGLIIALIGFFASYSFVVALGLLFWLASWSHFLFDSIEYGIMWLWPFSRKRLYVRYVERKNYGMKLSSVAYYRRKLCNYMSEWTFPVELVIIILALIVAFS